MILSVPFTTCLLVLVALSGVSAVTRLSCKGTDYEPIYEACCKGNVGMFVSLGGPKWDHPDCCGTQVYNKGSARCCESGSQTKVGYLRGMTQPGCCGLETYDKAVDKCCKNAEGAAVAVYNPIKQKCTDGSVQDLETDAGAEALQRSCGTYGKYDASKKVCCPDAGLFDIQENMAHPQCCDKKNLYDRKTSKCCGKRLYDLAGVTFPSCCKGTFYDGAVALCCDGTVGPFTGMERPRCCNKIVYDKTTQTCDDGFVNAKE